MMPKYDGPELVQRLRADPRTATLPIVMLTARGRREDITRGLAVGADDYILKPFDPVELLERLSHVLAWNQEGRSKEGAEQVRIAALRGALPDVTELERRRLATPIASGEADASPAWPVVRTEGLPPTPWTMPPQPWRERVMGKSKVALGPEVVTYGTVDGYRFSVCAYEVEPAPDAIPEGERGSRRGLWMVFEGEGIGGGTAGPMDVPEGLHMVVTGTISVDPPVLAWYGTVAEDVAAVQARLGDGRTQGVELRRVWAELPRMFVCFAPSDAETQLVALGGGAGVLERCDLPNATLGGGSGGVTFVREQP
jgi:hypothetical protein